MRSTVESDKTGSYQIWRNPEDNILYGTYGAPTHSFSEVGAFPLYDLSAHSATLQRIAKGESTDSLYKAFIDSGLEETAKQYKDDVIAGGAQKLAALRSSTNSAVNVINVWTEVQGLRDRKFAAKSLAREIPVKNLLISIDKATKFSGMTRIDEGQTGQLKELSYTRTNFSAQKYGLKFVIHEEARLKNVHNVMQDSIRVAANKVDQRASFDVITALSGLTAQAATGVWDTFVSGADRSSNSPLTDIGIAQLNIEGSGVGGRLTKVGMHPLTYAKYLENTFIRGVASSKSVDTAFENGDRELIGMPSVGLVLDNGIQQGITYAVDTTTEDSTVAYFQGPQRIGSAHDEESGDEKYFIIDYHNAAVIQSETGRQITGCITPIAW